MLAVGEVPERPNGPVSKDVRASYRKPFPYGVFRRKPFQLSFLGPPDVPRRFRAVPGVWRTTGNKRVTLWPFVAKALPDSRDWRVPHAVYSLAGAHVDPMQRPVHRDPVRVR